MIIETRLRFRSDPDRIDAVVGRVMRWVDPSGSRCDDVVDVELALREALMNAVKHGNRMDPEKWVHVWVVCEPAKAVSIVVKDGGQGFNPRNIPDPRSEEALLENHGRGVVMMRALMDEVSFERGGTEIHLRKNLARPRAGRCSETLENGALR